MSRVSLARRAITVTAASVFLMGAMLVPFASIASAAGETFCPPSGVEGPNTCILVIKSPTSARTGAPVTVQVLITSDGTTVASTDPCAASADVTIVASGPTEGDYFTSTVTASGGIATFSLTFPRHGTWSMTPSANVGDCRHYVFTVPPPGFTTIAVVDGTEPLFPCFGGTSCVQATSGTGTQATMIAGSGVFTPAAGFFGFFGTVAQMPFPGPPSLIATTTATPIPGSCPDTGPLDLRGVLGFHLDGSTAHFKVVVFGFDHNPYLLTKSIFKYDICWQQDTPFKSKTGQLVFRGYLPNCGFWDDRWEHGGRDDARRSGPPCILIRFPDRQGNGYIAVIAPIQANGHDPFGYGH